MTESERLDRLEDAVVALIEYATEGQPQRVTRSLTTPMQGAALLDFLASIKAERS